MEQENILNQTSAIILILLISISFVIIGYFYCNCSDSVEPSIAVVELLPLLIVFDTASK